MDKMLIKTEDDLCSMPLFKNSCFKIGNKTVFNKSMFDRGFRFVGDLLTDDGKFIDILYLEQCIGKRLNFVFYEGLKNTIKSYASLCNIRISDKHSCYGPLVSCYVLKSVLSNKANKEVYKTLIANNDIPTSQLKWSQYFNDINWKYAYKILFTITRDSYIQWLQLRILHRIIGTKSLLFHMNIVTDNLCTFCKEEEETIIHLFWSCTFIQNLLQEVKNVLRNNGISLDIREEDFIIGYSEKQIEKLYVLFLQIKKYIFTCKKREIIPNIYGLKGS